MKIKISKNKQVLREAKSRDREILVAAAKALGVSPKELYNMRPDEVKFAADFLGKKGLDDAIKIIARQHDTLDAVDAAQDEASRERLALRQRRAAAQKAGRSEPQDDVRDPLNPLGTAPMGSGEDQSLADYKARRVQKAIEKKKAEKLAAKKKRSALAGYRRKAYLDLKEQKEKNFFRAADFSQEYVNQVIREEFENVINEEINPLEIKRAICDKKDMIVGAIEAGKVNNMLWWAEALGIIPDEIEQARKILKNLLDTDPDKILQTPGAKEGAVVAIELMCMLPLEEVTVPQRGYRTQPVGRTTGKPVTPSTAARPKVKKKINLVARGQVKDEIFNMAKGYRVGEGKLANYKGIDITDGQKLPKLVIIKRVGIAKIGQLNVEGINSYIQTWINNVDSYDLGGRGARTQAAKAFKQVVLKMEYGTEAQQHLYDTNDNGSKIVRKLDDFIRIASETQRKVEPKPKPKPKPRPITMVKAPEKGSALDSAIDDLFK